MPKKRLELAGGDIREHGLNSSSTAVLQTDGSLVEPSTPPPAAPQYHGERTKSAASPRVHPRWKSARKPSAPETLASPLASRIVSPQSTRGANPAEQPVGLPAAAGEEPPLSPRLLLTAARMGIETPEKPYDIALPHKHTNWTPVARPVGTPSVSKLWRPLAGSDRRHHFASLPQRLSPRQRGVSPRHAMRVKPLKVRPALHVDEFPLPSQPGTPAVVGGSLRVGNDTAMSTSGGGGQRVVVAGSSAGTGFNLEPTLQNSLVIGRLISTPEGERSPATAAAAAAAAAARKHSIGSSVVSPLAGAAGPQPAVWGDAEETKSTALLPSLTQGPAEHKPQTTVKLWL